MTRQISVQFLRSVCVAAAALIPGHTLAQAPHPAVARIMVPEESAVSYGTGTLIDVRDQYGLVVTNWHVIRDGKGPPEVVFPNGFRSQARPLKLDSDWDLAALVIWRPPIDPVPISQNPPRPGDWLTICGYGQGDYQALTGRCTQYYAPSVDYPHELVELNVEARQGDSGGPILNAQGELAGVLFGAGRGTTMGSYGGRVHAFLASLAPNIGADSPAPVQVVAAQPPQSPKVELETASNENRDGERLAAALPRPQDVFEEPAGHVVQRQLHEPLSPPATRSASSNFAGVPDLAQSSQPSPSAPLASLKSPAPLPGTLGWRDIVGTTWLQQFMTLLVILGGAFFLMQLARWVG